MTKPLNYDHEFKQAAIKLAMSRGNVAGVARELGLEPYVLHNWIAHGRKKEARKERLMEQIGADAEIKALQRKVRELEEENDILKKAAAYFARSLQ